MNQLNSTTRRALALVAAALTAVLATSCGIRPTAVPVDAGAPASRTACPSPLHVPAAATTPMPTAPRIPGRPSPVTPSVVPTTLPPTSGSLFSAVPTPSPSATGTPACG